MHTEQEEVVTNGWSPSKRNNPFANSGIVTEVKWEDIPQHHDKGPLAGVAFQREVEQACWKAAGSTQAAPAQRLVDFVAGRASKDLPVNSYQPGTEPVRLDQLLPPFIANRLREAFNAFDRKIKGYLHPEAIVVENMRSGGFTYKTSDALHLKCWQMASPKWPCQ